MAGLKIGKVTIKLEDAATLRAIAAEHASPMVADTTRKILNRSRVLTPVRTGNLRASQRMVMRVTRTAVIGQVETRVKYAHYVHDGTRPHIIRARRVSTLRFIWHGQVVFRRLVHHPGFKGRPFLRTALFEVAEPAGFKVTGGAKGTLIADDLTG